MDSHGGVSKSDSANKAAHEPTSKVEEMKASQEPLSRCRNGQERDGGRECPAEEKPLRMDNHNGTTTTITTDTADTKGDGPSQQQQPPQQQQAPQAPQGPVIPDFLVFHKDPDRDDFGFKSVWEAMSNPMTHHYVRYAFRSTAFVAFPLFTIAIHPKTMFRLQFPNLLIASVVSFSTHRPTLGEQLGLHSWIWRGLVYGLVLNWFAEESGIVHHIGAWYGLIALGIFIASLLKHSWMRRFFYLYFFLGIMMLRMQLHFLGVVPPYSIPYFTADHYIGSLLGMAALLFPYPALTKVLVDAVVTKLFTGLSMMVGGMLAFVASPDVHAAEIFFNDLTPFEKIEGGLAMMPPVLWFTSWEPLEFPLRNPIRRLKLALMRRIMALTYAAFECGRVIVQLKKRVAEHKAMMQVHQEMLAIVGRNDDAAEEAARKEEDEARKDPNHALRKAQAEADREGMETLRQNSAEHAKAFAGVLVKSLQLIGSTEPRPEALIKEVPFEALSEKGVLARRNYRMELLQTLHLQKQRVAQKEKQRAQRKEERGKTEGEEEGVSPTVLNANDPNFSAPYGHRMYSPEKPHKEADKDNATGAGTIVGPQQPQQQQGGQGAVRHGVNTGWAYTLTDEELNHVLDCQDTLNSMEVYLTLNAIFFKMLLGMIAAEVENFGEMMKDYRPAKSIGRRLFEFFISEPWHDFWHGLWEQLTFATPESVRILKDAIKMVCAYMSACALNYEIWIPDGGLYFFGVTTLLGMPVEEETVTLCICRMAGNTLGCALGYLCYNNTHNLAQIIASTMCFAFFLRCLQHHPVVGQAFFYGAVITIAGAATSMMIMELLVRAVAGIYSVGAYTLCCMLVFPTNPAKVLWGYRMKFTKVMSELLDDVAATARLALPGAAAGLGNNNNATTTTAPFGRNEELVDASGREPMASGSAVNRNSAFNENTKNATSMSVVLAGMGYYSAGSSDEQCARLAVQLRLMSNMLNLSAKWTPFGASYPVIRGTDKFPEAASARVLSCHQRITAHMALLVFSMQLLHRPRDEPVNSLIQRTLMGPIADFLDAFSGATRLLSQDFIDSLQKPRTFVYPLYLSHVSHLSRMRARLDAISYQCYVFLGSLTNNASAGMTIEDYAALRAEQARGRGSGPAVSVQVDHGGGRSGWGDSLENAPHSTTASTVNGPGGETQAGAADTVDLNASIANRVLLRHHPDGAASAMATPNNGEGNSRNPGNTPLADGTFSEDMSRSFVRRAYRTQAPLQAGREEPTACYPMTPEDPEYRLREELRRTLEEREKSGKAAEHSSSRNASFAPSTRGGGELDRPHRGEAHEPVEPKRTQSALSRAVSNLIQPPSALTESLVPTYEGPGFSYREDALESPVDTDFLALVGILSSCLSIITDMERLAPPVNEISRYQKQLHETSWILPLLDKVSAKVKAYRKENYEKYHYPPPPPEKRNHLNAQDDLWRDWRF